MAIIIISMHLRIAWSVYVMYAYYVKASSTTDSHWIMSGVSPDVSRFGHIPVGYYGLDAEMFFSLWILSWVGEYSWRTCQMIEQISVVSYGVTWYDASLI